MSLPPERRPIQKPVRKVEESGDIVLAFYPEFVRSGRLVQKNGLKKAMEEALVDQSQEMSAFLKQVVKVEKYIGISKDLSFQKCAKDLGINMNEVRIIVQYLQKNKIKCVSCNLRFQTEDELNKHSNVHDQ